MENSEVTNSRGDPFQLPEEVQEVVLDHLSVKDLVTCCRVSRSWRAGINSSRIWKKWCKFESYNPELMEKHLDDAAERDDCSHMGWWRKVYGWHANLEMAWRRKTCRKFKLVENESPVYCFDADGELTATGHENSRVVVWSIEATPPSIVGSFNAALNSPISSVRVEGNFVVVLQRKLIQVYCKQGKLYGLTDLKSFEMGETNVDQMENYLAQRDEYSSWYLECLRAHNRMTPVNGLIYNVQGKSLFASSHHSKVVWAWTIPSSEVQFSVQVPGEVAQILKGPQGDVYFVARDHVTYLMKYELGNTPSLLVTVPGLKQMVVGEQLLLALPAPGDVTLKRIWVYSRADYSQPIGNRTISGFSVVAILAPLLVVYSEGTSVTVWDPVVNVSVSRFTVNESVSFLKPTFASFLLVFKNRSLHLWDWKRGERLYRIYNGLEWTGNYANLLWGKATMILSGGVANQLEMICFKSSSQPTLGRDDPQSSSTVINESSATIGQRNAILNLDPSLQSYRSSTSSKK